MTQVAIPRVYGGDDVSDDDVVDYGGYVAQVVGTVYEKVKPRWSDLQREKLIQAGRPADDKTLNRLLKGFPADWANSFARHNKLVGLDRGVGEFVPRLPIPQDAGEDYRSVELDAYNVMDSYRAEVEMKKQQADRVAVPKYFLHQIFSDTSVAEKLAMDAGMMMVVSRVAVGNPKAACDLIVKHAKENGLNIAVRVGDYSTSRKASRQRLLGASAGVTVEPYVCDVIGGKIAVKGVSGRGVSHEWTVTAELWQMPELDAVYKLATTKGATIVNTLFTLDMAKLGVELIPDAEDYGFDVQLHMGEYDGSVSGNRVSVFGDAVIEAAAGVFPIVCEGKVVASAVYAGDKRFFVNWHVISELHERMRDKESIVAVRLNSTSDELTALSLLNEVTNDVWLAELEVGYSAEISHLNPPRCRPAVPGEKVVAVYAVPTGVESTDFVFVENYDAGTVCMPRFPQARLGMSGAALIAVVDGALLGSYTGSNRTYSLGSSVHARRHLDWIGKAEVAVMAPGAFISGRGAGAIYQDIKARGLGPDITKVSAAIGCLTSAGRVVGNQYAHRAGAVTVLDPTVWNVTDENGLVLNFVKSVDGGVRPLTDADVSGPPGRLPVLEENVFAVHKDGQGVIFSDLLKVVWVSSDGSRCRLNGVPLFEGKFMKGAVLVALSDCSTLGLNSRTDEAAWGSYAECALWSSYFPLVGQGLIGLQKQGLFQRLSSRFQYLKTSTWEEADVRALVVGDVPSAGAYSRVGMAATLATVLGHFSQQDIQGIERLVTSRFHDDAWMMDLCEKVLPGGDKLFGSSCADKLNTLRIFLGLVYLREGNVGLEYVLDEIGLFDVVGYEEGRVVEDRFSKRPRSI